MKYLPTIAGVLLGLLFLMAAVPFVLNIIPPDEMPPPPTEEAKMFMGAFAPTGYMTFVKWLELIGAILVMVPKTRNYGLLVLGPITINILAYHAFVAKGSALSDPMSVGMIGMIVLLSLYLLWVGRKGFAALKN
jgi:uncharacterized membrane protein YphA (DoxX/SURF4 family)